MKPSSTRSPTGTATNSSRQYMPVGDAALTTRGLDHGAHPLLDHGGGPGTPLDRGLRIGQRSRAVARREVDRSAARACTARPIAVPARPPAPRRLVVGALVGLGLRRPVVALLVGVRSGAGLGPVSGSGEPIGRPGAGAGGGDRARDEGSGDSGAVAALVPALARRLNGSWTNSVGAAMPAPDTAGGSSVGAGAGTASSREQVTAGSCSLGSD